MRRLLRSLPLLLSVAGSLACCCVAPPPRNAGAPQAKAKPDAKPNEKPDEKAAPPGDGVPFLWEGKTVDPKTDDLPEFLKRFRNPDKLTDTDGKPASQTFKTLDYIKEGVSVSFTPNCPNRDTAKPPFERWALVNYYDLKTQQIIGVDVALKSLWPAARQGDVALILPLSERTTAVAKAPPPPKPAPSISRASYNQIQQGDAWDDVMEILGPGREAGQSGGIQIVTWQSSNIIQPTIISVTFQNGRVKAKSIIGP